MEEVEEIRLNQYQAAGGVVHYNGKLLVLLKPKANELRLPKGHIEPGETPEEAALREVAEESGYIDLEIIASLGTSLTEFNNHKKQERIVREESYFLMRPLGAKPVEQEREEAERAKFEPLWLDPQEALSSLSFETEREFLRRAIEYLSNQ
ncbi:MAG: NUDIX domain-containing protein [Chloroflexota bacterium]|nr:NUDIX domain-containing protein [Chloroflexota bacterium]